MPAAENTAVQKKRKDEAASPDRVIFLVVLFVIATVPALTFLFSFGNVGNLGVSLNVDKHIAYLTGPAIDLSVVGLIVAGSYLSHRGWSEKQLWPIHLMSVVCGLTMIALNCGQAMYQTKYRLAAFDAVGPLLLIGWGFIGPWLLRQLFAARSSTTEGVRVAAPKIAKVAPAVAAQPATVATPATATAPPVAPKVAPAVSTTASGNPAENNSNPPAKLMGRPQRLQIVRGLIDTHGTDVPLAVIQEAIGGDKSTASRIRKQAIAEPEPEPERVLEAARAVR